MREFRLSALTARARSGRMRRHLNGKLTSCARFTLPGIKATVDAIAFGAGLYVTDHGPFSSGFAVTARCRTWLSRVCATVACS